MSEIANMEGSKALARTLARKVQEYFRNPTHQQEFEEWFFKRYGVKWEDRNVL